MAALLDSHLHVYREEFEGEAEAVLERAHAAGVGGFLHVGFTFETNQLAQRARELGDDGFATAGLHPHDAEAWSSELVAQVRELATRGRIVAIGECGLDFYRDLSPRDVQERVFRDQIQLAKDLDLPMIHHVRDAYPEARAVLEDEGLPPRRGIFHAFAGDADFARWAVDNGYLLGIGGPLTYKSSDLSDFLASLPLDGLQLETDAPWLPPQPWRGQRNEPAYARFTAQRVAELYGVDLDAVAETLARSFERLFRVELSEDFWALRPSQGQDPPPRSRS